MPDFDVIIVGGRVAGSTLAARLIHRRVLLLERATFPSVPAASSPVIYAPAMSLLDEIGADEAAYAHNTPRLRRWVIEAEDAFTVHQTVPPMRTRDYAYAVDRARFDHALWKIAAARPNVTAKTGVAVTDLLWQGRRVVGVRCGDETYTAPLVVGADGRFSLVARKVGASAHHEHTRQPTSVYYAYWRDVAPYDDGTSVMQLHSNGGDYGFLLMDSADDTTVVVIEGRTDKLNPGAGNATAFYETMLRGHPGVWRRLTDAERVTPVLGMRKVGNFYRDGGGPGWALVGDALHQKDPLDGQGIFDALLMARLLANTLNEGGSMQDYERAVMFHTQPMYEATLRRVAREIYTRYPQWFMRTLARYVYEDETYRERWARLFVRDIPPEEWYSYGVVMLAVLRGLHRDTQKAAKRVKVRLESP